MMGTLDAQAEWSEMLWYEGHWKHMHLLDASRRRIMLQPELCGALISPEVDCRVGQPVHNRDAIALPKRHHPFSSDHLLEGL